MNEDEDKKKDRSAVAGTICKAFPVVGMMGNFQPFAHSTEENGVAA